MRRRVEKTGIMILLLLMSLALVNVLTVKASGTIYIRADGSIDPPTAPIYTVDKVTFTFADNVTASSIVIEKDDIVIDGNSYMLNGSVSGIRGFDISYRNNVTVKNVKITKFGDGVYVYHSNSCKILDTIVTDCWYAVDVMHSSNSNKVAGNIVNDSYGGISVDYSSNENTVTNNTVTNSKGYGWGLYLWSSSGNVFSDNIATNNSKGMDIRNAVSNTIRHNNISGNQRGIYLSSSSNNIISQNNITNNGNGIYLESSSDNSIYHNNLVNNIDYGFTLSSSEDNVISSNIVTGSFYGMWLYSISNNTLFGNNITNNHNGIELVYSFNNNLSGNMIDSNRYNFDVYGDRLGHFINAIDVSNLINGKPICYIINQKDLVIRSSTHPFVGYLGLVNCCNITVEALTLTNNGEGLLLAYTNNSRIMDNNVTENSLGVWLYESSDNTLSENNVTDNNIGMWLFRSPNNILKGNNIVSNSLGTHLYDYSNYNAIDGNNISNNGDGVWLDSSSSNTIFGNNMNANTNYAISVGGYCYDNTINENNIMLNGVGVGFFLSSGNKFYHNNFIDNTKQAYTQSVDYANVWDDGYPSGGNFWSDYTGVDLYSGPYQDETGSDGVGDDPCIIDANNRDSYPLTKPYAGLHDIGIISITTSKTVVGQGHSITITAKILNYGINTETFSLTLYGNTNIIQIITNIILTSRNSTTITFTWNTAGFAKGNYTISAYALPVLGETDTADNTYVNGWVIVAMPCDVANRTAPDPGTSDGKVDSEDVFWFLKAYGKRPGQQGWNPNCDVAGGTTWPPAPPDDIVNYKDIFWLLKYYGQTDP